MTRVLFALALILANRCATSAPSRYEMATPAGGALAARVVEADLFAVPAPAPPPPIVHDAGESIVHSQAVLDVDPMLVIEDAPPRIEATASTVTSSPNGDSGFQLDDETPLMASAEIPATPEPASVPPLAGEPVQLAAVEVEAAPAYEFKVHTGEYARDALERWSKDHDFTLVWQSRFDIPIIADATFPADSLRDAVTRLLRAIWHPKAPLIADEYPNRVLVIRQP